MKKFLSLFLLLCAIQLQAQERLICRNASVRFFSKMPLENIEAVNNQGLSVIDPKSGNIEFSVLLKSFIFPNALMQEHFNENYLESEKYPTASFKGKIKEQLDLSTAGTYPVTAEGSLTIHGVTKPVTVKGTILSSGKDLRLDFKFQVKPEEFKIEVPSLVVTKIAETIDVTGKMTFVKK